MKCTGRPACSFDLNALLSWKMQLVYETVFHKVTDVKISYCLSLGIFGLDVTAKFFHSKNNFSINLFVPCLRFCITVKFS